jgi:hypothetical protein
MPPYAICSSVHCHYFFDFKDDATEGPTRLPPEFCPHCTGRVLYFCRRCSRPILCANGGSKVICVVCGADVRTGQLNRPRTASAGA